jgi:hypothetical protein
VPERGGLGNKQLNVVSVNKQLKCQFQANHPHHCPSRSCGRSMLRLVMWHLVRVFCVQCNESGQEVQIERTMSSLVRAKALTPANVVAHVARMLTQDSQDGAGSTHLYWVVLSWSHQNRTLPSVRDCK